MVEFGRPFVAIRKDPRWVRKIALAAVINFIPYAGPVFVLGWSLEYLRRVAWGADESLPEWRGFGQHGLRGLYAYVAILPYSFVLGTIVGMFSGVAMIAATAPALSAMEQSAAPVAGAAVGLVTGLLMTLVILVLTYAIAPIIYSAMGRVALYDRLEAGFQFREIWASMKASRTTLMRAWGYTALLGLIVTLPLMVLSLTPFGALVWLAIATTTASPRALIGGAVASLIAMPVIMFVVGIVGVFTALVVYHYWGTHLRAAYKLGEPAAAGSPV